MPITTALEATMRVGFHIHRRNSLRRAMRTASLLMLFAGIAPLPAAEPAKAVTVKTETVTGVPPKLALKPLVWVVDGAGDLRGCSTSLAKTFADEVDFQPFSWSHGHRRIVVDQTDYKYARQQGERLAEAIQHRVKKEAGRRVVLVAHSAGAAVALAAAEKLEKKSIDRLVLLAPSVASQYDPLPAAQSSREGVDVFHSRKDIWALGIGVKLVGTTDDLRAGVAAGKVGFELKKDDPALRQHPWTKDDAKLGHTGGHYGAYSPEFAKKYLLPLLAGK